MKITVALVNGKGINFEFGKIHLEEPREDEVLVRIEALCPTEIHNKILLTH